MIWPYIAMVAALALGVNLGVLVMCLLRVTTSGQGDAIPLDLHTQQESH